MKTSLYSRLILFVAALLLCQTNAQIARAQGAADVTAETESGTYLYRIALVQATPGRYRDYLAFMKESFDRMEAGGAERPFRMRHSQGDWWDFMVIYPMESYRVFIDSAEDESAANHGFMAMSDLESELTAAHEDLFVRGPEWDLLEPILKANRFFHIEMFKALPGKHKELLHQRRMENVFIRGIDRQPNFIFERDAGSGVDAFTLGFYRDIKHFAEGADVSPELEEASALKAGFEGVGGISPYLRSLIAEHHDTLAVAID